MPDVAEPEYDRTTCIYAAELRAAGFPVPAGVPDVAWIPAGSIALRVGDAVGATTVEDITAGRVRVPIECQYTEPFRWIELDFAISADGAPVEPPAGTA